MNERLITAVELPASDAAPAVVHFQDVTISFDGPPILNDISFSLGPREGAFC